MARKYLRALQYTTGSGGKDISIFLKICYEFWGYCVNGTSSLTIPGGMPSTPTSAPTNFFEGTTVLATGNDGVTSDLGINFTSLSANFSQNMVGKHITLWSPGSNSTDDSIYRIVSVPSSTQLMLAPFSGGVPDISTLKNNLTSRSYISYRVVDLITASQLSVSNGNYFVGTLSGNADINILQTSSQFQIILRNSSVSQGMFGIVGSPTASWTGSNFSGTILTERNPTSTYFNGSATVIRDFPGTAANTQGYVTLIADKNFFIGHIRSPNAAVSGLYFYITTPQRFYTEAQDPNPLSIMVGANNFTSAVDTDSHTNSFAMVGLDGYTRTYQLMTRNFLGNGTNGAAYTIGPNLYSNLATQNRSLNKIYSNAIMSLVSTAGQYCLARCMLQPIAFTSNTISNFHLLGNNGEFIHVGNGTLWPWDSSIMPYSLFPLGT